MKAKLFPWVLLFGVLASVQLACGASSSSPMPEQVDAVRTQVAQTVVAELLLTAPAVPTAEPELPTDVPQPTAAQEPTVTPEPPSPTPSPTHTETPTPTTTVPVASSGVLVMRDDFEQGRIGWYEALDDDFGFEFTQGGYRIYNKLLGAVIWSIHNDDYADVRLEVDAHRLAGPEDGYYGVTCRYVDRENYYALTIGSDGFYGIGKMKDGEYAFIAQGKDNQNIIQTKLNVNRVRGDCVGETLTVYANGKQLLQVHDADFDSGDIGLVVGNKLVESGADVFFDNFEVWKP